jgi:hypothetical protein
MKKLEDVRANPSGKLEEKALDPTIAAMKFGVYYPEMQNCIP